MKQFVQAILLTAALLFGSSSSISAETSANVSAAGEQKGIMPARLVIPAIQLDTAVEPVGVLKNGQMGVPKAFDRVGILSPWTMPGEKGNAVIAGHLDHYTGPAVFYHLRKLKPNDKVLVLDRTGHTLTFQVEKVVAFRTREAPLQDIFGASDKARLNLITCTGKFNKRTQEHSMRLVVFCTLVN